ncbi:MAG: hydantoinase/oxoprolinase family protein [Thaumarchaeota archaeon]|nr:hydantoinase/oxoprolinase family protein [Nitrososphaerota archaeon]
MGSFRIGVDIGGTFTDVAVLDESSGNIAVAKVPTTPSDFVKGFLAGVRRASVPAEATSCIIHGTTVATNAVIQRSLPVTAFLATEGFQDMLEIMRGNRSMAGLYDIRWKKPSPLIPRRLRFGINERVDCTGKVVKNLDMDQAREVIRELKSLGVQAVAICFLFSNVNPSHERAVAKLVSELLPEVVVSLSSEVDPEIREYERMSTTAIDAAVKPIVGDYVRRLETALSKEGFVSPLMIMKSSGGMLSSKLVLDIPIHTIESGPAGGVIGATNLAGAHGGNLIIIDMGGTTFKVSLIEGGKPRLKNGGEIEWGIPYRIPMVDLSEIGTGGGSIAWIDRSGTLRVGPQSAGADPGPVCYGLGGTRPTFTDANLILGRLDPDSFLGGEMKLNKEIARKEIEKQIADPLGLDVVEAASGIIRIAESNMLGSMRISSVERGYDPRDFVTVAYGGAGPLVAANLARELGSPSAVIPPHPGIFSAIGMLYSDIRLDVSGTYMGPLKTIRMDSLSDAFDRLERQAASTLSRSYDGKVVFSRTADIRYVGQNHEVTTPVPSGALTEESRATIVENFNKEHWRYYGHFKPNEPTEMQTLRVAAIGTTAMPRRKKIERSGDIDRAFKGRRAVFFEEANGFLATTVFERGKLGAGARIAGPAVIEEMDSTIIIHPKQAASVNAFGDVVIKVK